MKVIAFISGKGGTGKTSLVASFAQLAAPVVAADCDVDAANLALLLGGTVDHQEGFVAGERARIDPDLCTGCGMCFEKCRFDAISQDELVYQVDPLACEGCRVCLQACAFDAVILEENKAGKVLVQTAPTGAVIQAALEPAQSNSGKLVTRVRVLAREQADNLGLDLVLLDGPPGIGCPVHATLADVDLAVVVTEPTPSGEHDLARALGLLTQFGRPALVIINKADLSPSMVQSIGDLTESHCAEVIGELPFVASVPASLAQRQTLLDNKTLRPLLEALWARVLAHPALGANPESVPLEAASR
jgi:MinD superfamily P-loop ATPase